MKTDRIRIETNMHRQALTRINTWHSEFTPGRSQRAGIAEEEAVAHAERVCDANRRIAAAGIDREEQTLP
jgi:hypothetical protein